MKFDTSYEELDAMIEEKVRTHDIKAYRRGFMRGVEFIQSELNKLLSDMVYAEQMVNRDDFYNERMDRIFSELKDERDEDECEAD